MRALQHPPATPRGDRELNAVNRSKAEASWSQLGGGAEGNRDLSSHLPGRLITCGVKLRSKSEPLPKSTRKTTILGETAVYLLHFWSTSLLLDPGIQIVITYRSRVAVWCTHPRPAVAVNGLLNNDSLPGK